MKRSRLLHAFLLAALLVSMASTRASANDMVPGGDPMHHHKFGALLRGSEEVPAVKTAAAGMAYFIHHHDGDMDMFEYGIRVKNISNVVAAHIHLGAPGSNGPVVVSLYGPASPGGGKFDGVLITGTFTAANLTGPLAGMTLHDLGHMIHEGSAYINIHTNDGVAPTNTGAGDMASGEIRGQIH